jgi:hypothetical protein
VISSFLTTVYFHYKNVSPEIENCDKPDQLDRKFRVTTSMKHLLINRFQGALIGINTIYITDRQPSPNQMVIDANPALIGGIDSLISRGRFDLQDWSDCNFMTTKDPAQAIVAMLPLMLFFHEDRVKLRETLINVSHSWQLDWETCSSSVAIGYILSRSLTESLSAQDIISQLLAEMINLNPLLFQELEQLDRYLARPHSLHQITQKSSEIAHPIIASTVLAIYCFLSTPEYFNLAILRAYRTQVGIPLTCALTGILAGAHNSLTGIPVNGVLATQNRERLMVAAAELLSTWAGVYHKHSSSSILPPGERAAIDRVLPVASPQVMQRRN